MKVLLLGPRGQVGWELQRALAPLGELIAPDRRAPSGLCGDIGDLNALTETVRSVRPDVIVNAAGFTEVDRAETEPRLALTLNVEAPALLAREARRLDAWLVHYSTDYVFDGSGERAWTETDAPRPLSVYGTTKLEGEIAIRASECRHLILRTSWVYAARGRNFLRSILRLALQKETLRVVADQFGSPTGAELIADVTAQVLPQVRRNPGSGGLYHLAAAGETSWHGYASFIVAHARAAGWPLRAVESAIEPISSEEFQAAARRPANSRLNCSALTATFGLHLPDWQSGVKRTLMESTPGSVT